MSAPKVSQTSSLDVVRTFLVYLIARLKTVADAAAVLAVYVGLRTTWTTTHTEEQNFVDATTIAQAAIDAADAALDALVDKFVHLLLAIPGVTRTSPLWVNYFKGKTPQQLRTPVLGIELEALRSWLPALKIASQPTLVAFGVELAAAIAVADAAVLQQATAAQENHDFRSLGDRFTFIESINTAGVAAFAALDKIRTDNPAKNYPADFATSFFPHRTATTVTDAQLATQIAAAETTLTTLQKEQTARAAAATTKAADAKTLATDTAKLKTDEASVAADKKADTTATAVAKTDAAAAKKLDA